VPDVSAQLCLVEFTSPKIKVPMVGALSSVKATLAARFNVLKSAKLSMALGGPVGVQLAALFQLPPAALFHAFVVAARTGLARAAVNRAAAMACLRVLIVFIGFKRCVKLRN
jgi:hypothetical protein